MLPSFLGKTVVAWRKVSCFFRLLLPHVDTFTIYNVLFRASRCSKKRYNPPPPPSLDQARFIFAWLVLFSRCPYYLRALHRPVNKALMFLKNTQGCTHYRVRQNASQSGFPVALRQKFSSYHGRLQISRPY